MYIAEVRNNTMSTYCPFTTSLFICSTIAYVSYERRKQARKRSALSQAKNDSISSRGDTALTPVLPYLGAFFMCLEDPCDADRNPEGHIALCVAENTLVQEVLAARLMRQGTAPHAFSDSVAYCYNGMLGLPVAREAVAYFLEKRFLQCSTSANYASANSASANSASANSASASVSVSDSVENSSNSTLARINPEHIAIGAGAASILNNLFFTIAEPGEGVLVPAPFYAAFVNDMKVVAGCVPIPVQCADPVRGPTVHELEVTANAAEKDILKDGKKVKILLLTNPNNPLGTAYSATIIQDSITWARSRGMHTIADEIYALSMHNIDKSNGEEFISVIKILQNNLKDDVHFVWALSKDFGASGFRIGILYSQNDLLMQALSNLNIFSCVSHPMQLIMADLLMDDNFIDPFLIESKRRLRKSYLLCTSKLDEMVIDYIAADGGIFVYCDFSSLLPTQTFDAEARFREIVERYARIVMTPGESQFDNRPGRFRICYAWVSEDVLAIAMERLSYLITKLRKMDWLHEINEDYLNDVVSGAIDRIEKRRHRSISHHKDSMDLSKHR